jgi:hypothetical protein
MPNRAWSELELDILLSSKNKKNCKIEGRSKKSIRRKLIQLGIIKKLYTVKFHNKRKWTEEELNLLKSSKESLIKNRTQESIRRMKKKLNLVPINPSRKKWKKKEESCLIKLCKEGKTAFEIFNMKIFKYSKNSIQKKICYLGLSKQTKIEKFPKDILQEFKNFLKENYVGNTPEDLVEFWNSKNSFKTNYKKVLYHLRLLKIKIPYAEVAIIKNLRKKEKKIANNLVDQKTTKLLSDSIRFARAEVMRKRMLKNRDIWSGMPLPDELLTEQND